MTIKIYSDRIDIGDFTLFEGNGGLQFDGVARAENFRGVSQAQGFSTGYSSGGRTDPSPLPVLTNVIDKFPFTTASNATDVGDLSQAREHAAGQSSFTHGYVSGGPQAGGNTIDKFPFVSDTNSTDIADLTQGRFGPSGHSSTEHGYSAGGYVAPPAVTYNTIDRFPFASDTNASDYADLNIKKTKQAGVSSYTHGYTAAGYYQLGPSTFNGYNTIEKFSFSSTAAATDVGDITRVTNDAGGVNSSTHGYIFHTGPAPVGTFIDKFPFATNVNAVTVGGIGVLVSLQGGNSSATEGFLTGGNPFNNQIRKFPFASDGFDASDYGDLSQLRHKPSSQQV